MATQKLILTFPPRLVREPITYRLAKDYDIMVNILRAKITPDEAGHMVAELDGTSEQLAKARKYLEDLGVGFEPLEKEVRWSDEKCVRCTACVSVCPTGALHAERETMDVQFDADKCIACELCIPVCMYDAMEIRV